LNDRAIAFAEYGFYRGPFVNSSLNSGIITLTAGGMKRVLDFNAVSITDTRER